MSGTVFVINESEVSTCPSHMVLPFDASKTTKIGWGGYSTVYKEIIAIHHFKYKRKPSPTSPILNEVVSARLIDHQSLLMNSKAPLPVACKRFPYAPDFHREWEFLQSLNVSPHRHVGVIQELAALLHDDTYHLLLPLADSDLANLLIQTDVSTLSLKDLLNQASGLADALSWLHGGIHTLDGRKLIACHIDMKPSNILVFHLEESSSAGTWLITDFSTSTLTDGDGTELLPAPRIVEDIYSAPELQAQPEKNRASPECDVWSLGCILFEILLCFVDGREESVEWRDEWGNMPCFHKERMGERGLASRLHQWLSEGVLSDSAESQRVESFKKLVLGTLKIVPAERPTAEDLKKSLTSIFSQC
ncbi:hypothetical protein VTL71DRAFT_10782 [Oculimacula yallundae]|uniref:Protein kinase domain-containing protein n=1 Tax=Oculimacula yallundae TaxID=86028 RepID=A0ABR4CTY9_9HELO